VAAVVLTVGLAAPAALAEEALEALQLALAEPQTLVAGVGLEVI
jgi:hypothetical protein